MDTGGLAQMSYNDFQGIGVPGSGFATRGKGSNIKRLSFQPNEVAEQLADGQATPRTSRSHLLAGLRTAPKTPSFPPSAPASQLHHRIMENSMYADSQNARNYGPKTSVGQGFNAQTPNFASSQMYSLPEDLAQQEIVGNEYGQEQLDPNEYYAQLVATNMYLAEQQRQLQQQLTSVQSVSQQFNSMNINHMGHLVQQQQQQLQQNQFSTPPITPSMALYHQQQQQLQAMQPIITPVPGTVGIYSVYDPTTGQTQVCVDTSVTQQQMQDESLQQRPGTPGFQVSPPRDNSLPLRTPSKTRSSPPQNHTPLPPPSANAFRRGHKKSPSSINVNGVEGESGPRNAIGPKTALIPQTPMSGMFGPGQARAGEHPVRQPKGPPSLDELKEKPTTKFEGSKNFATRQRRVAVNNLVRAGMERRRTPGSAGSISPSSEKGELNFPRYSSGNDSDSGRSGYGNIIGRPPLGSARTSAHGAIGSDRPSSRQSQKSRSTEERNSVDSSITAVSTASEDNAVGGSFAAVFKNKKAETMDMPRKAGMLAFKSSTDKRKSNTFS